MIEALLIYRFFLSDKISIFQDGFFVFVWLCIWLNNNNEILLIKIIKAQLKAIRILQQQLPEQSLTIELFPLKKKTVVLTQ